MWSCWATWLEGSGVCWTEWEKQTPSLRSDCYPADCNTGRRGETPEGRSCDQIMWSDHVIRSCDQITCFITFHTVVVVWWYLIESCCNTNKYRWAGPHEGDDNTKLYATLHCSQLFRSYTVNFLEYNRVEMRACIYNLSVIFKQGFNRLPSKERDFGRYRISFRCNCYDQFTGQMVFRCPL